MAPTQYVVPRNFNSVDAKNDYTSFIASQATWSEWNLPPILYQIDLVASQKRTGSLPLHMHNGQRIMGPNGSFLRDYAQSDQEENAKDQDKRKGATIEKDGNNEKKDENTGNDTNQRQLRRVGQ
ncbi:hypothetical protein MMC24_004628 [Lignoscripta atroalba]|nr:hypothetical protein [Lignoscripta atroalba]